MLTSNCFLAIFLFIFSSTLQIPSDLPFVIKRHAVSEISAIRYNATYISSPLILPLTTEVMDPDQSETTQTATEVLVTDDPIISLLEIIIVALMGAVVLLTLCIAFTVCCSHRKTDKKHVINVAPAPER